MKGIFLFLWISSIFCGLDAALRKYFVEELCHQTSNPVIQLGDGNTGILVLHSSETIQECEIELLPSSYSRVLSVVLSIYEYQLQDQDQLIIEDSDQYKVALVGRGYFPDEKKSILSDGYITIHLKRNSTLYPNNYMKFQFTFTLTHSGACASDEFLCRNKRCIPKRLVCDSHNHCGDNSDQDSNCGTTTYDRIIPDKEIVTRDYYLSFLPTILIILAVLVLIIIIVGIVFCVRALKKKKKEASQSDMPTVAATVSTSPATPIDIQARPTVFGQIRRSLRFNRNQKPAETTAAEVQKSEEYQVPSMYPQLPTAPGFSGIENPDFKTGE